MDEIKKALFAENEKLLIESNKLLKKLRADKEYRDALKERKVDALVIKDQTGLKVFTEETSDKTYRILIENMHEGAVTLDKNGTILYCNSCFAKLLKNPLEKTIGSSLLDFIEPHYKKLFEELFHQGWKNSVREEINIFDSDNKTVPVLMSLNTITLDDDLVLSIIVTDLTISNDSRDRLKYKTRQIEEKNSEIENTHKELASKIYEKEKQEQELNLANIDVKELGELNLHKESVLATLSHDLRSPLTGIIGASAYLKDNFDHLKKEDVKELLAQLHKAAVDELNMLDHLVEWARIKYASETFAPINLKLSDYVNKVFDTLKENAKLRNINLFTDINDNVAVFADGKMLLSILQNIVSNAIKYTQPGGKVSITAYKKEDKIVVEVKDTGTGMSKEIMEKLFTPQMKSLSSTRDQNKGAGIGLLLVKVFIEKNNGEVWVESKEGEGTTFYFSLPTVL
ncbi:MAG: sensor histidine kinase [Flavisolibacter sp.]